MMQSAPTIENPSPECLSITGRRWQFRHVDERDVSTLIQKVGLDPALAEYLSGRKITPEIAAEFLSPSLRRMMPDPLSLAGMTEAVERLKKAIYGAEKIAIFGDYDVDGTSSAALLTRYFRALNIAPIVHLPDRFMEGYGPSTQAFSALKDQGADLIITVDCGAMAHEVLEKARADGLDIIVLDHHQMTLPLPPCAAVVNPNRPDDVSGLTTLSAAGVVFMTLAALNRSLREEGYFDSIKEPDLMQHLDLVALGLVCDVMPLQGLTRVLVAQGLKVLGFFDKEDPLGARANSLPAYPGLLALAGITGATGKASSYHLGFVLGPRINAAGRIGHANLAYKLMTETDPAKARVLADQLHGLNAERQFIEGDVERQAIASLQTPEEAPVLIASGQSWHIGVIGIVAGRLKEKYLKPAMVISFENGIGKASGRSIKGVDLGKAIHMAVNKGLLIGGGGHAMACGFTIREAQLPEFTAFMNDYLASELSQATEHLHLTLDGHVRASAVNRSLCDTLDQAGPFGAGNSEPVFVLEDVQILSPVIRGEKHIACSFVDRGGSRVRAIAFRCVGEALGEVLLAGGQEHHRRFDVAGKVKADEWRGGNAAQFIIEDLMERQC